MRIYNLLYGVIIIGLMVLIGCDDNHSDLVDYSASDKITMAKLELSRDSVPFDAGDENPEIPPQIIHINSNTSWDIIIPEDLGNWLTIDTPSGNGDGDITFMATPNNTHNPRDSKLYIRYDTNNGKDSTEIIVTQNKDKYIDIKGSTLPFEFNKGEKVFVVESNVYWHLQFKDGTWCSSKTVEGEKTQDIIVLCDSNTNVGVRKDMVYIYFGSALASAVIKDSIEIVQEPDYFLKAEDDYEKPKPPIEFGYRGGTEHFKINSNVDWQITLNSEWINDISAHEIGNSNSDAFKKTVDGETHIIRGKGNAIIYISATSLEYAPQGTSRSDATIIIDCTDTSKGVRCPPITVSQKPY